MVTGQTPYPAGGASEAFDRLVEIIAGLDRPDASRRGDVRRLAIELCGRQPRNDTAFQSISALLAAFDALTDALSAPERKNLSWYRMECIYASVRMLPAVGRLDQMRAAG